MPDTMLNKSKIVFSTISCISKWSGTTFQTNTSFVNRLRTIKNHKHCNEPKITALPSVILEIYLLQNADSRIFGDKKRGKKKAFLFMTLTKCHIENDTVAIKLCKNSYSRYDGLGTTGTTRHSRGSRLLYT